MGSCRVAGARCSPRAARRRWRWRSRAAARHAAVLVQVRRATAAPGSAIRRPSGHSHSAGPRGYAAAGWPGSTSRRSSKVSKPGRITIRPGHPAHTASYRRCFETASKIHPGPPHGGRPSRCRSGPSTSSPLLCGSTRSRDPIFINTVESEHSFIKSSLSIRELLRAKSSIKMKS